MIVSECRAHAGDISEARVEQSFTTPVITERQTDRRMGTHHNECSIQVVIDVHFRDRRRPDVAQVEVACLGRERRPTRRGLARDLVRRAPFVPAVEVEDVEPKCRVRCQQCLLSRDDRHPEWQRATLGQGDVLEVLAQRPIRRHGPDCEEARSLWRALDGDDQLLAVFGEEHLRRRVCGPCRRCLCALEGAGICEQAEGVADRDGPEFLVDLIAVHAAHRAAIEHAEASAVHVERE